MCTVNYMHDPALRTQDSTRGFVRVKTLNIGFWSLFNTIIVDIEAAYKVTKHWRHVNIIHYFIDMPYTNIVSHITLIMNIFWDELMRSHGSLHVLLVYANRVIIKSGGDWGFWAIVHVYIFRNNISPYGALARVWIGRR
jgi:hypothetical protein